MRSDFQYIGSYVYSIFASYSPKYPSLKFQFTYLGRSTEQYRIFYFLQKKGVILKVVFFPSWFGSGKVCQIDFPRPSPVWITWESCLESWVTPWHELRSWEFEAAPDSACSGYGSEEWRGPFCKKWRDEQRSCKEIGARNFRPGFFFLWLHILN
jgi:hypothetical protein